MTSASFKREKQFPGYRDFLSLLSEHSVPWYVSEVSFNSLIHKRGVLLVRVGKGTTLDYIKMQCLQTGGGLSDFLTGIALCRPISGHMW